MTLQFRFHREATAGITTSPQAVFAFLDDHRPLAGHMEKPSLKMSGATKTIKTDSRRGQAVGYQIQLKRHVLGIPVCVKETAGH